MEHITGFFTNFEITPLILLIIFSDCKPKTPAKEAQSAQSASKLWELSCRLVGLNS